VYAKKTHTQQFGAHPTMYSKPGNDGNRYIPDNDLLSNNLQEELGDKGTVTWQSKFIDNLDWCCKECFHKYKYNGQLLT